MSNIDFLAEAGSLLPETCQVRKTLHRHPEIGNQEFFTSNFIADYLNNLGLEVIRVLDTGVIGVLKGALPGKTVALRSDIDALPIKEATGCDFASENEGRMHACGHDMHMTGVLLAAKLLASHSDEIKGKIYFVFQPDEEGSGGAIRMIKTGVLKDTSAIFGAHIDPYLPDGTVGFKYGKFYAAADNFKVKVIGESCHGATPEKGHDALACASEMVVELNKLTKQFTDKTVLTIGKFSSGTAVNIVSGESEFSGMIRSLGKENRARIKVLFYQTAQKVADQYGCQVDISYTESYMGIVNSDDKTAFALAKAKQLFGEEGVVVLEEPLMITEDFGYFVEEYTGCFYHVSANCHLPLHHDHFLPDEKMLEKMVALHSKVLFEYLDEE